MSPIRFDEYFVVADTREQTPLTPLLEDCGHHVISSTLKTGDYSVKGYEDFVAIERKSLDDLVGSLTNGRQRFERELSRGCRLERFCVVVEAPYSDILDKKYRSKAHPASITGSIKAFEWRYRCRFYFCNDRYEASRTISRLLHLFVSDDRYGKRVKR